MLLIVSERTAWWKDQAVRLNRQGIFAFLVPFEQGLRYCKTLATGGVVIDCVRHLKRGEALCRRMRESYPELPIAALLCKKAIPDMPVSRVFRESEEDLFSLLLDFCTVSCGWDTGKLSTHALTVANTPCETFYMGCPLGLTERENLMRLCYPGQMKSTSNLTVHIQSINQKAALIDPRPLIVNERAKGYRLRDGILL